MIKFGDLEVKNERAIETVVKVMRSGQFINGRYNEAFERVWAEECGADQCVLTASGSAALTAVLKQIKSTNVTKVVMPALSFAATAFAAIEAGCQPVYVDVNDQGLIRWDQVEDYVSTHASESIAVMPVHMYGQLSIIPGWVRDKVLVIQDACQAHGLIDMDEQLGSAIACFSFYPAKNLGAIGDAGAVVFKGLNDLANRVRSYINYGDAPGQKYVHGIQGNNLRCDEVQSAYLLEAYKDFHDNEWARTLLAKTYIDLGVVSFASILRNNWHLYPILVEEPERFRRLLRDYNIETGNHYPYTLPGAAGGYTVTDCTRAAYIAKHVVTLPIHPRLTNEQAEYVANTIKTLCDFDDGLWIIKE